MPSGPNEPILERILREERELVYAFGGYALEFSGGALLTNERLPVPRFNFVQDVRVARDRMAAFFERALDHYFQRAIRPVFHLPEPPAGYLADALAAYGFAPRGELRRVLRCARPGPAAGAPEGVEVREAAEEELEGWVRAWSTTREGEELARFLEVNRHHPNPGEVLRPVLAARDGALLATALLHGFHGSWGLHGVGTQPGRRGSGAASALVAEVARRFVPPEDLLALWLEHDAARAHLQALGFEELGRFRVFELGPNSELHLPPTPPSGGPLWRPRPSPGSARDPPTGGP